MMYNNLTQKNIFFTCAAFGNLHFCNFLLTEPRSTLQDVFYVLYPYSCPTYLRNKLWESQEGGLPLNIRFWKQ